ncbi:hypothetical protein FVP33_16375 [Lacisediminihabitans profunda]|uniref:DUF5671 domain-containing protein n=1 Tax=Lacisediminihabitans profunda TaxID=2594790 RepID=A0A5C8ULY7_9MICO|nr:hypothetical protein FVP33_16375 [Lacisediminihabitans profunda]
MRRVIVFVLLFAMVAITASGVSGLLGRLFDAANYRLASNDVAGLALSLAFSLVAGPLAAVLWWLLWRRMAVAAERSSLSWGLYLAGMSTVALITFTAALLQTLSALVRGSWQPYGLGTAIAWGAVWVWHRWMSARATKSPTRLEGVAPVLGAFYGLAIGVGGAVTALGGLLDAVVGGFDSSVEVGNPWWRPALQALVWATGGAVVWWWHWMRDDARSRRTGLGPVVLVIVNGFGAVVLTLGGVATALFLLLRVAFDRTEPVAAILDRFGTAIAAASVGALVWAYYRGRVAAASEPTRTASRLVTSGVTLAAAASGFGVIVNSILAAIGTPLTESGARSLLLGGISALVVGAPVWWFVWRPASRVSAAESGSTGRRIYLVAVFGASAVAALITLLVIGFRIFEFTLDSLTGQSLLDRVRAPLGLLLATGLAAGYHFTVWRLDRAAAPAAPRAARTIGRVILVGGQDAEPLRQVIEDATGAAVTLWVRAAPFPAPTAEQVIAALAGVSGSRVLLVAGPDGRLEVIPLLG